MADHPRSKKEQQRRAKARRRAGKKSGPPSDRPSDPRPSDPRSTDPRSSARPSEGAELDEPMRLNKYISRAGIASRRKADEMIAQGLVKINGDVVQELGSKVAPGDAVEVNGQVISPQPFVYYLLNKPDDVITTTDDEHDRRTVMDLITVSEEEKQGVFPVGRLDRHTVGVLVLTNDGDLAHRLMHPRYEIEKLYVVETKDAVKPHQLDQLRSGVRLEDGLARADRAAYLEPPNHHRVGLMLHEGRNRQIRRMLEALGHEVALLERVSYAGLTSDGVRRGRWRVLAPHEVKRLRNLVNLR